MPCAAKVLGVSKTAGDTEIKQASASAAASCMLAVGKCFDMICALQAYRKLALKLHPDKQGAASEKAKREAQAKFVAVQVTDRRLTAAINVGLALRKQTANSSSCPGVHQTSSPLVQCKLLLLCCAASVRTNQ